MFKNMLNKNLRGRRNHAFTWERGVFSFDLYFVRERGMCEITLYLDKQKYVEGLPQPLFSQVATTVIRSPKRGKVIQAANDWLHEQIALLSHVERDSVIAALNSRGLLDVQVIGHRDLTYTVKPNGKEVAFQKDAILTVFRDWLFNPVIIKDGERSVHLVLSQGI